MTTLPTTHLSFVAYIRKYMNLPFIFIQWTDLKTLLHINRPYDIHLSQIASKSYPYVNYTSEPRLFYMELIESLRSLISDQCMKQSRRGVGWLYTEKGGDLFYGSLLQLARHLKYVCSLFQIPLFHLVYEMTDVNHNLLNFLMDTSGSSSASSFQSYFTKKSKKQCSVLRWLSVLQNEIDKTMAMYLEQGGSRHYLYIMDVLMVYQNIVNHLTRICMSSSEIVMETLINRKVRCLIDEKTTECFNRLNKIFCCNSSEDSCTIKFHRLTVSYYQVECPLGLCLCAARYLRQKKIKHTLLIHKRDIVDKIIFRDIEKINHNAKNTKTDSLFLNKFFCGRGWFQESLLPQKRKHQDGSFFEPRTKYVKFIKEKIKLPVVTPMAHNRMVLIPNVVVIHLSCHTYKIQNNENKIINKPLVSTLAKYQTATCSYYKIIQEDNVLPTPNTYNFNIQGNDLKVRQVLLQFYNAYFSSFPQQKMTIKVSNVCMTDRVLQSGILNGHGYRTALLKKYNNYVKVDSFPALRRVDNGNGRNNVLIHKEGLLTRINVLNSMRACQDVSREIRDTAEFLPDLTDITYQVEAHKKDLSCYIVIGLIKLLYLNFAKNDNEQIVSIFTKKLLINRFIVAQNYGFCLHGLWAPGLKKRPIESTSIKSNKKTNCDKPPVLKCEKLLNDVSACYEDTNKKYYNNKVYYKQGTFSFVMCLLYASYDVFKSNLLSEIIDSLRMVIKNEEKRGKKTFTETKHLLQMIEDFRQNIHDG